jgi:hypothetical protein
MIFIIIIYNKICLTSVVDNWIISIILAAINIDSDVTFVQTIES